MGKNRGLQPLVGAVILIAIVLLLATTALVFVTQFETEQRAPQAATNVIFYSEFNVSSGAATPYIKLEQRGGETLQREDLRAVLTVGGKTYDNLSLAGSDSGAVRAGDDLKYNASTADLCSRPEDEFTVRLVHGPSNKPIGTQRVDIRDEIDVNVSDKAVTSNVPFRATVTIVGMAASSKSGDRLEPDTLTARVVVNRPSGTTYLTPWPDGDPNDSITNRFEDNINRPKRSPGISYTTTELPSNASVSLEMRSGKPRNWDYAGAPTVTRDGTTYEVGDPVEADGLKEARFWVDSSNTDEGNLILLQDDEAVPTYGLAGDHQRSLEEILGPRLDNTDGDSDREVNIDQNDVVVLYELTNPDAQPEKAPDPGSTGNPDYNDAVAIIEIEPVPGASTSDPGVLYC